MIKYSEDGSIVSANMSELFDGVIWGSIRTGSGEQPYLLENRLPEAITGEELVLAKKTSDTGGSHIEQHYLDDVALRVDVYQGDELVSSKYLEDGINSCSSLRTDIPIALSGNTDGIELRVEVYGEAVRKGELLGVTTYTHTPAELLELTDVQRELSDRNHAVYSVGVRNAGGAAVSGKTVTVEIGDEVFVSEAFDLAAGRERVVTVEAAFPEEVFEEERADGWIRETATAVIRVGTESRTDRLVRAGLEAYEPLLDALFLKDTIRGQAAAASAALLTGDYLLLHPTADGLESGLTWQVESADEAVAAADAIGGVTALGIGSTELTFLVAPDSAGVARSENGGGGVYDGYLLLPSALFRTLTLSVTVSEAPPVNPAPPVPPVNRTVPEIPEEPAGPSEPARPLPAFDDVPADSWYAEAVAWALDNGITFGVAPSQFAPEQTCTRAQIVTFLYRFSKKA